MDLLVAGIAVAAFAAVVLVLAGAGRRIDRTPPRTVIDAEGDEWMRVDEVAALLDTDPAHIVDLAERGAIPHYVLAGDRRRRTIYRFRRDEIDAWTIG